MLLERVTPPDKHPCCGARNNRHCCLHSYWVMGLEHLISKKNSKSDGKCEQNKGSLIFSHFKKVEASQRRWHMQRFRKGATRIDLGEDWRAPEAEGCCQWKGFFLPEPLSPGRSFWEAVRELVGGQAVLDSSGHWSLCLSLRWENIRGIIRKGCIF